MLYFLAPVNRPEAFKSSEFLPFYVSLFERFGNFVPQLLIEMHEHYAVDHEQNGREHDRHKKRSSDGIIERHAVEQAHGRQTFPSRRTPFGKIVG